MFMLLHEASKMDKDKSQLYTQPLFFSGYKNQQLTYDTNEVRIKLLWLWLCMVVFRK